MPHLAQVFFAMTCLVTKKWGKAYAIYSKADSQPDESPNYLNIPDCSVYGSFFAVNLHAWDTTRSLSFWLKAVLQESRGISLAAS
jgi:hypothetical protein